MAATRDHPALALWAKSGDPPHLLLAHLLDTAAVARAVLLREPSRTLQLYAADWGLPADQALAWASFVVGLHDLGKASPSFQMLWPQGATRVREAGLTWNDALQDHPIAHGVFTEIFLRRLLQRRGVPARVANDLSKALGAHHGFLPSLKDGTDQARLLLRLELGPWWEARGWLMDYMAECLRIQYPTVESTSPQAILRIMALASFSDWVASDPRLFPYGRNPLDANYWPHALHLAEAALDSIRWHRHEPDSPRQFHSFFPNISPNQLQQAIPAAVNAASGKPHLILIEAPMGAGKTEAALYASHLLQCALGHRGLYFALPTQATANGLFPRAQAFLERLLPPGTAQLQLQHGTALLAFDHGEIPEKIRPERVGDTDDENSAAAASWFSMRKRAMLSPHGVGTLDQALLGVLRVKHHFVRLWGLMNRVVVLDEVHAYDVYTSGLLLTLLRWLRALESSTIVMTATLPASRRSELLKAWTGTAGTGVQPGPYPRLMAFAGDEPAAVVPLTPSRVTEVTLAICPAEVEAVACRLLASLPGALGAIVNTVDRAQSLYRALGEGVPLTLKELCELLGPSPATGPWEEVKAATTQKAGWVVGKRLRDGTLVLLLHARFPAEERALRETIALALFGKHGPRPAKAILIATQVAEQSLDLDFDLLYSDLAPIDLIFQRAGRLHRHHRQRPLPHLAPVLLLGLPEDLDFGRPLYWDRVYEDFVLLATWMALRSRTALSLPRDIEPLLEAVYESDPEGFPEPLRKRARESYSSLQRRREAEAESARKLSLSDLGKLLAYADEAAMVADFRLDDDEEHKDTQRLLTRLGDPSVAVVPLFRVGEQLCLDREGKRWARLGGELSREDAVTIFQRAVRLSRFPIPQELSRENPPSAWRRTGLLRGLLPLEVGRVFGTHGNRFRVELDPELGVVYTMV